VSDLLYFVLCGVLIVGILVGIYLMSKIKSAAFGNILSAACVAAAITLTLVRFDIITLPELLICAAVGLVIGLISAYRVKMIEMPQVVSMLSGFGGAASAFVAIITVSGNTAINALGLIAAGLALTTGAITFIGSLIAAGKLHKILKQAPVAWKRHQVIATVFLVASFISVIMLTITSIPVLYRILFSLIVSGIFGFVFAIRIGGADMPITISLLNSLSGLSVSATGMIISDPLLVAVGAIVGASGLLLTQIMCKAMNRRLMDILTGKTAVAPPTNSSSAKNESESEPNSANTDSTETILTNQELFEPTISNKEQLIKEETEIQEKPSPVQLLKSAKNVIIATGYGMALAQAQHLVKKLADALEANDAEVVYAIHPVAGRMPGHMSVLLAEADVPFEKLIDIDDVNSMFAECDLAIVIGANDVINPAANSAEGTPIYGMPILDVHEAKNIIICNYDLTPGYSGVENTLYSREGVILLTGDASKTLEDLLGSIS